MQAFFFEIIQLAPEHMEEATGLLRDALGEEYITQNYLSLIVESDYDALPGATDKLGLVAVDISRSHVFGVVLCEIVSRERVEQSLHGFADSLPPADLFRLRNSKPGFLGSVVVDARYRRCGVATSLIREALRRLRASGVENLYGFAWKRPDGSCPSRGLLESLGLEAAAEIPNFWKSESEVKGYDCPVCGNPCVCSAIVMCTRPSVEQSAGVVA